MKPNRRSGNKFTSGFTFIEVVLAISILAIIMSVAYSALSQIIRTKKILDDTRDAKVVADSVLTRLTRELQLAYSDAPLLPPREKQDQPFSPRINLIGEAKDLNNDESGDSITFLALEGGQYVGDRSTRPGIVQITYRVEPDPEAREEKDRTYYLVRDETPYLSKAEDAYKQSMIFPITKRLVSFKVRYFDKTADEWSSTWGAPPKVKLPGIVRFTIKIKSPNGVLQEYTTAVALRAAQE